MAGGKGETEKWKEGSKRSAAESPPVSPSFLVLRESLDVEKQFNLPFCHSMPACVSNYYREQASNFQSFPQKKAKMLLTESHTSPSPDIIILSLPMLIPQNETN